MGEFAIKVVVVETVADRVKVGIDPGSVCTTRIKTGVVYPQLSAIIECADGGGAIPGEGAKAFGAGADFVILGGLRSTCTYVAASTLKELTKRTTFIRVAEQESRVYTKK